MITQGKDAKWLAVLAGVAVGLGAAGGLRAQPTSEPGKPAAASGGAPAKPEATAKPEAAAERPLTAPSMTELAARGLVRAALTDLRANPASTTEDYRVALALLRKACELMPGDSDLLRLALDAAEQAGETSASEAILREIVRVDPEDTVSQLSLITARINRLQDIASRIAQYEIFLGPRGAGLDATVRSRLALDLALLLRERGDAAGFQKRLTEATQLDKTNKDAAALAYAFYRETGGDEVQRLEMLVNLLGADPLDEATHLEMARLLAAVGASSEAMRFYRNAMALTEIEGRQPDLEIATERSNVFFAADGPEAALKELNKTVRDARRDLTSLRRQLEEAKKPVTDIPEVSTIRLDLANERTRLLAAHALGDQESLSESAQDLVASITALDGYIEKPDTRPKRMTEERVKLLKDVWRIDGPFVMLLVGLDLTGAEKQIEALRGAKDELAPSAAVMARLEGWLALRKGKLDDARGWFDKGEASDACVQLGRAALAEIEGDKGRSAEMYAAVWRGASETYLGAYARAMSKKLSGKQPPAALVGQRAGAYAQGVPKWVDDMMRSPRSFMTIAAAPEKTSVGPLDFVKMTVKMRNTGQTTLRVSAEGPLNSRFLLSPDVRVGATIETGVPEVIRLDRRFSLEPRQEIAVTVWADPGYGGWLMDNVAVDSSRVRYRVLQGFEVVDGLTKQGSHSLAVDVEQVRREGLRGMKAPIGELMDRVEKSEGADFAHAIASSQMKLASVGTEGGMSSSDAQQLCNALLKRYAKESTQGRLFMLTRVPSTPGAGVFSSGARAIEDTDAAVNIAKIVTRVSNAEDPWLKSMLNNKDAEVALVAKLHQQRLSAGASVLANMKAVRIPTTTTTAPAGNPAAKGAAPAGASTPAGTTGATPGATPASTPSGSGGGGSGGGGGK